MNKKSFKVSMVIPNYNGEEILKKNLQKIVDISKNPKNLIQEIIVVDDGSTDGSVKFIKENFPEIRLIRHKINRGVATALNTGVRSCKEELVLMISTDMIPQKNLVENILPDFENEKVFGISFNEKDFGPEKGYWKEGLIQIDKETGSKETKRSFYIRKGEGIFRRNIWIQIGGMDEKLFLPFYWDDLDICYRAAKRGYINLWEPKAVVLHDHWGTMGKFPKKFVNDAKETHMLFMIWKNIHSQAMMRRHISGLFSKIFKNPGYLRIVILALSKLDLVLKARQKERRESKISDEAIFAMFA